MTKKLPGRPATYPWKTMKVGEEFDFNTDNLRSAQSAAYAMGRDLRKVFQATKDRYGNISCKRIR